MKENQDAQGYAILPTDDVLEGGSTQTQPLSVPDVFQDVPFSSDRGGAGDRPSRAGVRQTSLLDLPESFEAPNYVHYPSNLPTFDSEIINPVSACKPKYLVVSCHCGRRVVKSTCMKLSCKTCKDTLTMRRARSVMERLMQLSYKDGATQLYPTVLYIVFTMPLSLRAKCKDRTYMVHLRKKIWTMLQTVAHARFAFEATHPISEDHPDEFHPHLNFLVVQKPGHSPYLNLSELRAYYADILGYDGTPDIYSQYSNKPGQLWKWCQYVSRTFPAFSKWCGSTKWFGKYPKAKRKESQVCADCGQKISILGYIDYADLMLYELYGFAAGHDPPWLNDKKITPFHRIKHTDELAPVSAEYYKD